VGVPADLWSVTSMLGRRAIEYVRLVKEVEALAQEADSTVEAADDCRLDRIEIRARIAALRRRLSILPQQLGH
jgi:hypothetical protein